MAVAVIAVIAVFFLGMGSYALAAPAALVRPFGITLGESASRSEVRGLRRLRRGDRWCVGVCSYQARRHPGRHRDHRRRRIGRHGVRPPGVGGRR